MSENCKNQINYEELEKKVDVLAKAYQELREKGQSTILSGQKSDEKPSPTNATPESRPNSPSRNPDVVVIPISKSSSVVGGKDNHSESNKRNIAERLNGESDSKKLHKDREVSP